jgi:uncharacterized heparinase superfamily protein
MLLNSGFKKIQLLFNTIKYLKAGQISNRIKRKFIKPNVSLLDIPETLAPVSELKPVVECSQRMLDENSFKFLNREFALKAAEDWNSKSQEKLWLYNLHYFDDLNAINSKQRAIWHGDLIQKWIEDNPLGLGNGWESYPSSLRVVNWVKWFLWGLKLNNNTKQIWIDSLAIQTRFLSQNLEYHLLGNHLFSNAKALVFAGLFFKGEEADCWYQLGVSIINRELSEQILADGGHFELSPMYHAIFLEDLLDLVNIHQAYDRSLPNNLENKIAQMFEWLKAMCHPDGEIAFFNDSTLSISPTFNNLLDYATRLDIAHNDRQLKALSYLKESGYIRVDREGLALIADVAEIGPDYIPGHGHADALSFELSLFGERVIVNSGISTYESGVERNIQRGSLAHSTVTVDDNNSSEIWGGFRVAKRAKIFNIKNSKDNGNIQFSACHDGYKRLKGMVTHCREWNISENLLEIKDDITGSGNHKVTSVLPLHPEVVVNSVKDDSIVLKIKERSVKVSFKGKGVLLVKNSHYHPEFGLSIDNKQLVYSYNGTLPFKTSIKISW